MVILREINFDESDLPSENQLLPPDEELQTKDKIWLVPCQMRTMFEQNPNITDFVTVCMPKYRLSLPGEATRPRVRTYSEGPYILKMCKDFNVRHHAIAYEKSLDTYPVELPPLFGSGTTWGEHSRRIDGNVEHVETVAQFVAGLGGVNSANVGMYFNYWGGFRLNQRVLPLWSPAAKHQIIVQYKRQIPGGLQAFKHRFFGKETIFGDYRPKNSSISLILRDEVMPKYLKAGRMLETALGADKFEGIISDFPELFARILEKASSDPMLQLTTPRAGHTM